MVRAMLVTKNRPARTGRGAGERIGLAAAGHEAGDAASASPAAEAHAAALGALQQNHPDQGEHDDQVDDDENCLHRFQKP
jgi:hypothetical protein